MTDGIITIMDERDVPIMTNVTLLSSSWDSIALTQNVTVVGILEDATKQIVNVSPVGSSMIAAANSVIYCSGQAEDTLIFTCLDIPTEDVVYNVSIQGAMYMG